MAPTNLWNVLAARQSGGDFDDDDDYCNTYDCYSSWDSWGRWVALVIIIITGILILFAFSWINNRRRRRQGMQPVYGTGWFGPKPGQYNQAQQPYYAHQQQQPPHYGAPAPPYTPSPMGNQQTGNTFNSNEGYYGHGGSYELQQPQSAYQPQRGGEPVYDAPTGPPPAKN